MDLLLHLDNMSPVRSLARTKGASPTEFLGGLKHHQETTLRKDLGGATSYGMNILEKQLSKLKGKTAWITGGKRVGQEVAKILAEQGMNIVASYRSSSKEAEAIVKMAENAGATGLAIQADVSSRDSMKKAVELVAGKFTSIDILINMASVFKPVEFGNITEADWKANIEAHILGTFWPTQVISAIMPVGSHIINIADRTSLGKVYKGYLPYVVTKSAVASMTKAVATELAGRGIFVNAIAPGPILRPDDITEKEWAGIRDSSALKYNIDDDEAVAQFALLVLYLSTVTMASGYVYPLDQGQNL